jgi:hypothetical protein
MAYWTDTKYVGCQVLAAVVTKTLIFWDITPCSPLKVNQLFGGTCRLHCKSRKISQARNQHEAGSKQSPAIRKTSLFWDITPCSPLKVNQHFRGTCRLNLQGRWISQAEKQYRSDSKDRYEKFARKVLISPPHIEHSWTNLKKQCRSWETNIRPASKEMSRFLWNIKCLLSCSQEPATDRCPQTTPVHNFSLYIFSVHLILSYPVFPLISSVPARTSRLSELCVWT